MPKRSAKDQAALDYIRDHPGCTALQIFEARKAAPLSWWEHWFGVSLASVHASIWNLIDARVVTYKPEGPDAPGRRPLFRYWLA